MDTLRRALEHISDVAEVPSFSSYEERLHPVIHEVFSHISNARQYDVTGNNIVYRIGGKQKGTIALSAHLDKINHYGEQYPDRLPVKTTSTYIEGAMDDSAGVGILLAIAGLSEHAALPELLFFFSEMEESKGLKEHPKLLKDAGEGYSSGMGAKRIARRCIALKLIPDEVITVDTTPLFKGKTGLALYSKHWELNELEASEDLMQRTAAIEQRFKRIDSSIQLENNTNDYLHYGFEFNHDAPYTVPSVALEPSIFPYHQKGERVFISDIKATVDVLEAYLTAEDSV